MAEDFRRVIDVSGPRRRAERTMARRVCVRNIMHIIMEPFYVTRTATVSKPYAIDVSSRMADPSTPIIVRIILRQARLRTSEPPR
jgi:hypothetical protein